MPTLRELTDAIQQRPGVQAVVILGSDGLVIETHDADHDNAEEVAARVPAVERAAGHLGDAAHAGRPESIVIELEQGFGVILRLSDQALLFVSTSRSVPLGDLLFNLRQHRAAMAALV